MLKDDTTLAWVRCFLIHWVFRLGVCWICSANAVGLSQVQDIRVWPATDKTRVVLDVDAAFQYKVFRLDQPPRVVIDIPHADWKVKKTIPDLAGTPIRGIRHGRPRTHQLRVVLDLIPVSESGGIEHAHTLLQPSAHHGHRLVVDLRAKQSNKKASVPAVPPQRTKATSQTASSAPHPGQWRDVVVAIDPGHGGADPGAIGKHGTQEKKVVLEVARRLKKIVDAAPGMRAVLTRDKDEFVGLAKRRVLARNQHRADIFVSLHADAWKNRKARGASVYVLSRRGASSALGRYLAQKENSVDKIGGIEVAQQDKVLRKVLADLAMEGSLEHSFRVAEYVLDELDKTTHLHKRSVEQAGFMVLKSLDIPSLLVEMGFISNPGEEKKLTDHRYQQKLAQALFKAIHAYFKTLPPPDTYFAAKPNHKMASQHSVLAGETLSGIAQKHRISVAQLKRRNRLTSDRIRVGQVLNLP